MRIMRYLVTLGLVALGAMAIGVPAASAVETPEDSLAAAFTGATTVLNPPVKWVGGTGSFTFGGAGSCVFTDDDFATEEPGPDPAGPAAAVLLQPPLGPGCGFNATGTYINQVCGTGSADGTATITGGPEGTVTAKFHLDFVAGQGVLTVNDPAASDGDGAEHAVGTGFVNITPQTPPPPPDPAQPDFGNCVFNFNVVGAFNAHLLEP
jgi:hypothetical protein